MSQTTLERAVEDVGPLRAVFITAMPDCLLYDAWERAEDGFEVEEIAAYFGDLVRSNRQGLKALGSWSSDMQVTIESAESLVVIREINEHFVCGCVFERSAPLGMVRLQMKRMIERIAEMLPQVEAQERPRGVRLVEFVSRYAPDPHAALMRISVRTGLTMEQLEAAEGLDADAVERLESATKRILGLTQLSV
ncbi:MAG: hypothetical protein VYE22_30115 [Myxococcota bacterium]|nr:hypothetical protein [Myxococcota bacterium]